MTPSFTINNLNQITQSLDYNGGKTVSYVYDKNGNQTNKTVGASTVTTYVYDYDNRLTQATSGTAVNTFKYDYRSRRYYRSTPTETNLCVFDGGLCVQEYDASDNNLTPHVSRLTTEYLRGPDLGGGVGGMVCSIRDGEKIYSHSNHRGDVIARTDGNGSLTWYAVYEAYGTRPFEWSDGTTGNPDRQMANTKDEEAELGLLNEGMRYRDLETGTFLTRDPIRYADGPNMYCYVHCNPITSFDPLGLDNLFFSDADLSMQSIQNAAPPGIYMSVDGYSDSIGIYNPGQSFLARVSAPLEASAEVLDAVLPHPIGDTMMANELWKQGGWKNRTIAAVVMLGVVTDVADILSPWPDAIDVVQKGVREAAEASVEKGAKEVAQESLQIGYHATDPKTAQLIMNSGEFRPSSGGRVGPGQYVADTPGGAVAEFQAHRGVGAEASVLEIQYDAGRNLDISNAQAQGYKPSVNQGNQLATESSADSITYQSVRDGGSANTVIRNSSGTPTRIIDE